ncbi:Cation_ATPase_N domain-containing protein [Psidium guajava]|nr:Cation_ATPase_N domain-containing protein [Psidium guajava]
MEKDHQPNYPGFQYFPPPSAWIDPNPVSYDGGEDCDNTPAWVIVSIVIVLLIFFGFLFYYLWRRQKKIWGKACSACAPAAKPAAAPAKPA